MSELDLAAARARAAAARADFSATLQELQARLRPGSLASDAIGELKRKGEAAAGEAVEAVRRRPVIASAAVAGLGALIGARFFIRHRHDPEGDRS